MVKYLDGINEAESNFIMNLDTVYTVDLFGRPNAAVQQQAWNLRQSNW